MYKDLREWLARIEELGALRRVSGVNLDLEMGALYELSRDRKDMPSILFENIPGYPPGYRIAATPPSPRNTSVTLDLPVAAGIVEKTQLIRERIRDLKRVPPRVVTTSPVLENVHLGEDVDLFEFPVPKWHEMDGGYYMGTGDLVVTRDPDEGWVNAGTYRVQRHDRNTLGFFVEPGKHAWIQREKYYGRGQPCPVAISFGHDPLLGIVGSAALPWGVSEYEYAGGLKGEPIEVISGPVTGLPIPASAEIAIEGESYLGDTHLEGPFGEFTGYYASGERLEPVIRVKSVLHRHNPILLGTPPQKPRAGAVTHIMRAATVWNGLERAGIPDIVTVACHMISFFTVVSIRQRYPGHAKQVGAVACQLPGAACLGRWTVVVDDDIDPTDLDEVMWALTTRCDPATSIDFLRRCWSTPLDPMAHSGLAAEGQMVFNSRAIVDACIPYELKSRKLFPAVVGASPELRAEVESRYGTQLD